MTILYSNGCSFTANFKLDRKDRYPIILADRLGWKCYDRAEPGSCNNRIIRTTFKECVELKNQTNEDIVALIQLSFINRIEYPISVNSTTDPFCSAKSNNPMNDTLSSVTKQYLESYWKLHNDQHVLANLCTSMIGLTSFFAQQNIKYFIYIGPNENKLWVDTLRSDIRFSFLQKQPGILDLENFNMLGLIGKQSEHPDEQDMQIIADYFFNLLVEPE